MLENSKVVENQLRITNGVIEKLISNQNVNMEIDHTDIPKISSEKRPFSSILAPEYLLIEDTCLTFFLLINSSIFISFGCIIYPLSSIIALGKLIF